MSDRRDLRPSGDVVVAHLDEESVLLHVGTRRYFRLNGTAAAIWRGIEAGADEAALVDSLVARFEVDRDEAEREVARVVRELRDDALLAREA